MWRFGRGGEAVASGSCCGGCDDDDDCCSSWLLVAPPSGELDDGLVCGCEEDCCVVLSLWSEDGALAASG